MAPRSAAQSLYPHLPSAEREPVKQSGRSVADALWPSLSREAKAKEADERLWEAICKRQRDNFLRGWRERERGR
jgi:hypothetical protein